jgi:tetratricopeptide (TPR) repeat protein
VSYAAYIVKFFYPVGLAVLYPYPESGLPFWKIVFSLLALTGVSVSALIWRRRFPYLFVGWFWYLGMLVPVIGLVQVGMQSMADRYTYLPQIGLALAVVWGVAEICASRRLRLGCIVVPALAIPILMGLAWKQASYWRNSETLWTRALACTTQNYIAENNLGVALANRGQVDAAIAHCRKALQIKPDYAVAYNDLGYILTQRRQLDAAVTHYQKALQLRPDYTEAHYNLGIVLSKAGQVEAAMAHYRKALKTQPDFAKARYNLGSLLARRGRIDEALVHFQKALEIMPYSAEIHNNMGIALADLGQTDKAIAHFRKALQINPSYAEARHNLGLATKVQEKP